MRDFPEYEGYFRVKKTRSQREFDREYPPESENQ